MQPRLTSPLWLATLLPWLTVAALTSTPAAAQPAAPPVATSPPAPLTPATPTPAADSAEADPRLAASEDELPAVPAEAPIGGPTTPQIHVETNVIFAEPEGVPLACDIYRPVPRDGTSDAAAESARRPAVLVVHGGGWASGDKWTTAGYARSFAEAGMVAVAINYRLAPAHKFPAQVDDIRAALVWLHNHAEQYGVDTTRIGIFGYSAGAHLACMIGTLADAEWTDIAPTTRWDQHDPRWQQIPKVCAIVGGGSPCEFRGLPMDNTAIAYFLGGPRRELPEVYRAASPAAHASPGDVPTLFVHGTSDVIVPVASSRVLFDAQIAAGVTSEFLALDGSGHLLTFLNPTTKQAALDFLTSRLRP